MSDIENSLADVVAWKLDAGSAKLSEIATDAIAEIKRLRARVAELEEAVREAKRLLRLIVPDSFNWAAVDDADQWLAKWGRK